MRRYVRGRIHLTVSVLALTAIILSLPACGAKNPQGQREEDPTYVVVQNRGPVDMTIYVMRATQRYRLGICPGTSTRRFRIPSSLVFGATPLRFLADPIGSSRTPVSNEIPVRPGDTVTLMIPWSG